MKGIILAGGSGTRLYPLTRAVSKQLLPIYNKPAIYYPLSALMLGGMREILIISTPRDLPMIRDLLGDGSKFGISLSYAVQTKPEGIAQALIIAEPFLNGDSCCLILGDNLFYGHEFIDGVKNCLTLEHGAVIFAHRVSHPEHYGVVEFDDAGKVTNLVEKPKTPKSNWAVPGIYFYDPQASRLAKSLKHSARGELEITDLNRLYLSEGALSVRPMGRGVAWLDTGTFETMLAASIFVQTLEQRQGLQVGCIEEVAYNQKWIDLAQLERLQHESANSGYGDYLRSIPGEAAVKAKIVNISSNPD